jgi:4-amino-4-deoxy-L-arabinose transferase-like glycosyltransferase
LSSEKKSIGVILLIALGLRLLLFLAVGTWRHDAQKRQYLHVDTIQYQQLALNLIENRVFSSSKGPPFEPEIYWTPGYPIFLATVFTFAGIKSYVAIFLQLLIGSATCLLVFSIGKSVFGPKVGLLAGIIAGLEYSSIFYSNVLLTETLFTFLFAAHALFLLRFFSTKKNGWIAASAIFLGISTLTRPVCIYFPVFLCLVFIVHFRSDPKKGIIKYSVFLIIFLAVIMPWMTRNLSVSGKFLVSSAQEQVLDWTLYKIIDSFESNIPSSSREGQVLDSRRHPDAREERPGRSIPGALLETSKKYVFASMRFFLTPSSGALPRLLRLPSQELEKFNLSFEKPWDSVVSAMQSKTVLERFIFVIVICFLLILYLTSFLGILRAKKEFRKEMLLFILIIVYFAMSSVSFTWTMRYRVPIMPYVILLSSYGFVFLFERVRQISEARKQAEKT